MSFPFVVKTDWKKWFEKACPKCRKLVFEFVLKECGKDLKERLLRGVQATINISGLDPIWDQLCERDRSLLLSYTELDLREDVKERLLRGESSPRPPRKRRRDRGRSP